MYTIYLDKVHKNFDVLATKIEPEASCGRKLLLCFMISNSIEKEVMKRAFLLDKVFSPPPSAYNQPSCWYITARTHANWFSTDQRLLTLEYVDHILEHYYFSWLALFLCSKNRSNICFPGAYSFIEDQKDRTNFIKSPTGRNIYNEALPRNLV